MVAVTRTVTAMKDEKTAEKLPATITPWKYTIVWFNVAFYVVLHSIALYGLWRALFNPTLAIQALMIGYTAAGLGINIGAHRLYSHRAFKANLLVRIIVNACHAFIGQNCMWVWIRDHRVHHPYSDTDADPHCAARGFFFAHMGWLMVKKHPSVLEKSRLVDMSDIEADPVVMSQKNFFYAWYLGTTIPLSVLYPLWQGHSLADAVFIAWIFRYVCVLHSTWLVNSWAHYFGTRPYDKGILPVETAFVNFVSLGEGWHNYHHAFPWDYKASEYGLWNPVTHVIDILAELGWVWDRRTVSPDVLAKSIVRRGDGTYDYTPDIKKMCDDIRKNTINEDEITKMTNGAE